MKLGVRQNIPVILRPASLPVEREPWKGLSWSLRDGKVQVRNASPYVVRLAKSVSIMPLGIPLDLPRTYVLPGEELVLTGAEVVGATVRLSPASTYGFAMGTYDAPLVAR
ncbi:putative fimbrial chaperone protein [compost metagenome]